MPIRVCRRTAWLAILDWKGPAVIRLTRLNGQALAVNSDLIKFVENAPDTVLTLVNGEKVLVRESSEQVLALILQFRRAVIAKQPVAAVEPGPAAPGTAGLRNDFERAQLQREVEGG